MAEFTVKCNECGDELDADFSGNALYVDPCEKCLDDAKDEGYKAGLELAEGGKGMKKKPKISDLQKLRKHQSLTEEIKAGLNNKKKMYENKIRIIAELLTKPTKKGV